MKRKSRRIRVYSKSGNVIDSGLGILRRKRRSPETVIENPHVISVSDGLAECKPHRWTGPATKLQEHLQEKPGRIVTLKAEGALALQRPPEMDESRRAMLRAGALGALGVGGAYALSRMAQPAQAAPGDGISGVTIAPGSVDAKRIGGLYFAENYDSAKHAGTDADPWSIAAIDGALAAIGSVRAVLVLTGVHSITANRTIPANICLDVQMGMVKPANGVTVTINGPLSAPLSQIFSLVGTGVVVFGTGAVKEFYPQWWGAIGDGVTDDRASIQGAIAAAITANGGIIFFPDGTYLVNIPAANFAGGYYYGLDVLNTGAGFPNRPPIRLRGHNARLLAGSLQNSPGNQNVMLHITSVGTSPVTIEGLYVDMNDQSASGPTKNTGGVRHNRTSGENAPITFFVRCRFERTASWIYSDGGDLEVLNCYSILGTDALPSTNGIVASGRGDCLIQGCRMISAWDDAIFVNNPPPSTEPMNVRILGNYISAIRNRARCVAIQNANANEGRIVIAGNNFRNNGANNPNGQNASIAIISTSDSGVTQNNPIVTQNILIENNTIVGVLRFGDMEYGILLGCESLGGATLNPTVRDVIIRGNLFYNINGPAIGFSCRPGQAGLTYTITEIDIDGNEIINSNAGNNASTNPRAWPLAYVAIDSVAGTFNLSKILLRHNRIANESGNIPGVIQTSGLNQSNPNVTINKSGAYTLFENNFVSLSVTIADLTAVLVAKDNIGFNPQGVAAITVTASPFTYTNNDGVPEAVYITNVGGGTVSDISKNSISISPTAPFTVWLEPGEAVVVTYTGTITMKKDRK